MKTKTPILMALFFIPITLVYAGDPVVTSTKATSKTADISFTINELAPVAPKEATFNDYEPVPSSYISYLSSITLTDVISELISKEVVIPAFEPVFLLKFAPGTPVEAGFDEIEIGFDTGTNGLAPLTPAEAGFEEGQTRFDQIPITRK